MSEILQFPYPEELGPPYLGGEKNFNPATTEGYENLQQAAQEWLSRTSGGELDLSTMINLRRLAEHYGHEPAKDENFYDQVNEILTNPDTRAMRIELQKEHIDFIIMSPLLGVYQKEDLLALSAQALFDDQSPADGKKIVMRAINSWQKLNIRALGSYPVDNRKARTQLAEHLRALQTDIGQALPSMSFSELYKHMASAETGQPVTSTIAAFGIMFSVLDRPSPHDVQRIRQRYIRRLDRQLKLAQWQEAKAQASLLKAMDKVELIDSELHPRSNDDFPFIDD